MSYRNFLDEVKKGLPLGNYILVSSDPFLHTEAVLSIKALVRPDERDFNFQTFDLLNSNGTPFDQIIDVLNTMPFFSGRKFVVIDNFQKALKKDLKKLEQYLSRPFGSSVMVLLNSGPPKKDVKEGLAGLKQIILDISEREIPSWVKARAGSKGIIISEKAANYLIATVGPDLGLLSAEIDKCALIGKTNLEVEDINEVIEGKRTYNAFALTDAIKSRDLDRVFNIHKVLRDTEEPYSLLGALNWQYGRYSGASATPEQKGYYYNVFGLLHEADVEIKSSGGAYPLELLLVKLLRLSRRS